ncbi:MAG TPA: COQ9 family protein [Stellaceae bacterium]|nr:COQ9 family protein [Stellaceae bacterium]
MDEQERRWALIEAVLPDVPFDGWSRGAIAAAARRLGWDEAALAALFPGGPRDVVAGFSRWADQRMLAALAGQDVEAMKPHERVAAAIRARLAVFEPHREAVRRALALLALPQHAPLGLRLLYDTVDAVWRAAGDTASDFSFYTKRGLLAGVYAATTLYWLEDRSPGSTETQAFLDRRLDHVMALPRLGARLRRRLDGLPNPFRLMRIARRR